MKTINLDDTLFKITEEDPELIPVLKDLGFAGVSNPVMRNTHGRIMTINMGIDKLGMNKEAIVKALTEKGYNIP